MQKCPIEKFTALTVTSIIKDVFDKFPGHFRATFRHFGKLSDNLWTIVGQRSGNFWATFVQLLQPMHLFPMVIMGHSRYADIPVSLTKKDLICDDCGILDALIGL